MVTATSTQSSLSVSLTSSDLTVPLARLGELSVSHSVNWSTHPPQFLSAPQHWCGQKRFRVPLCLLYGKYLPLLHVDFCVEQRTESADARLSVQSCVCVRVRVQAALPSTALRMLPNTKLCWQETGLQVDVAQPSWIHVNDLGCRTVPLPRWPVFSDPLIPDTVSFVTRTHRCLLGVRMSAIPHIRWHSSQCNHHHYICRFFSVVFKCNFPYSLNTDCFISESVIFPYIAF